MVTGVVRRRSYSPSTRSRGVCGAQVLAEPYVDLMDNMIASTSSFCIVVIFLCSFTFKVDGLVTLPDVQGKLTTAQQDTYTVDQVGASHAPTHAPTTPTRTH